MNDSETLRLCIAELHEAVEVANRRAAKCDGHESHRDYAEGVAAGLQRALDVLTKRVLKSIGVKMQSQLNRPIGERKS